MKTIAPNLKIEHVIETTPWVVERITTHLEEFSETCPDLEILSGSGGSKKFSIVTDGTHAVLVNAEGYDYPRYRGPRIVVELLKNITPAIAKKICTRKSFWPSWYTIIHQETLDRLQEKPWAVCN